MSTTISDFTRTKIKEGLAKLNDKHQLLFKRMYSHNNLELPIDEVVDNMPSDRLSWALEQVETTIRGTA